MPDLEKAQFSIGDFEDGCHCLTADYTKKRLLCPKLYNSFFASLSMSKPLSMKVLEVYCNFCGSGDGHVFTIPEHLPRKFHGEIPIFV